MSKPAYSQILKYLVTIHQNHELWNDRSGLVKELNVAKEASSYTMERLLIEAMTSNPTNSLSDIRIQMRTMIGEILLKELTGIIQKCEEKNKVFEDPISHLIMIDPVSLRETGNQFDRTSLLEHLQKSSQDPLDSSKKLQDRRFVSLRHVKATIQNFINEITPKSISIIQEVALMHLNGVNHGSIMINKCFPLSITNEYVFTESQRKILEWSLKIVGFLKTYLRRKLPIEILQIEESLFQISKNYTKLFNTRVLIYRMMKPSPRKFEFLRCRVLDCFSTSSSSPSFSIDEYSEEMKKSLIMEMMEFLEKEGKEPAMIHDVVVKYYIPILGERNQVEKIEIFDRFHKMFPENELFLLSLFESLPSSEKRYRLKKARIALLLAQQKMMPKDNDKADNNQQQSPSSLFALPSDWEAVEKYLSLTIELHDSKPSLQTLSIHHLLEFYEKHDHPTEGHQSEKIARLYILLSSTGVLSIENRRRRSGFAAFTKILTEEEKKMELERLSLLEKAYSIHPRIRGLKEKLKKMYIETGNYKKLVELVRRPPSIQQQQQPQKVTGTTKILIEIMESLKCELDMLKVFVLQSLGSDASAKNNNSYEEEEGEGEDDEDDFFEENEGGDDNNQNNNNNDRSESIEDDFFDQNLQQIIRRTTQPSDNKKNNKLNFGIFKPVVVQRRRRQQQPKKRKKGKKDVKKKEEEEEEEEDQNKKKNGHHLMKKKNDKKSFGRLKDEMETEFHQFTTNYSSSMHRRVDDPFFNDRYRKRRNGMRHNKFREEEEEEDDDDDARNKMNDKLYQTRRNLRIRSKIRQRKLRKKKLKKLMKEFRIENDEILSLFSPEEIKKQEIEKAINQSTIDELMRQRKVAKENEVDYIQRREELKRERMRQDEEEKKNRIERQKDEENYVSVSDILSVSSSSGGKQVAESSKRISPSTISNNNNSNNNNRKKKKKKKKKKKSSDDYSDDDDDDTSDDDDDDYSDFEKDPIELTTIKEGEEDFFFVVDNPEVSGVSNMVSYSPIHTLHGMRWMLKVVLEICGTISVYLILAEPNKKVYGSLYVYFNQKEKDSYRDPSKKYLGNEGSECIDPYSGGNSKELHPGVLLDCNSRKKKDDHDTHFQLETDLRRCNNYWIGRSEFECIGFTRAFPFRNNYRNLGKQWMVSGKVRVERIEDVGVIGFEEDSRIDQLIESMHFLRLREDYSIERDPHLEKFLDPLGSSDEDSFYLPSTSTTSSEKNEENGGGDDDDQEEEGEDDDDVFKMKTSYDFVGI